MNQDGGQNRSYHHGDLRRALLDAARETIRRKGASGVTLRGVARAAHVSHAAPYHHFKDKDALLAAVAEEGFCALREFVEARSKQAKSPSLAFQEAAVAYVVFATERPDLFRVMFGPQLSDKTAYPSLKSAAENAYGAIEEGLKRFGRPAEEPTTPPRELAVASWATIHGLAMLLIDKQFGSIDAHEAEHLARKVTDVFWMGLSHYGTERT